jgi:hypothetical protein
VDAPSLGLTFPPRSTRAVAIANATVVPLDRDGVLPRHTVVLRDGVIESVAPSGSVDTRAMEVVDGAGGYVVPGLSDMHVHVRAERGPADAALYLWNGVTTVRNMWGRPAMLAWEQRVRDGTIPGPHLSTASPLVDGIGDDGAPIWPGSIELTDPAKAAAIVESFARRGYRDMKVYSWLSRDCFLALCRAAKQHGIRVVGHCPEGITYEEAMDAGMECFEHLTAFAFGHLRNGQTMPRLRDRRNRNSNAEATRLIAQEVDWDAVTRLAHEMAQRGVWICPTVVVWDRGGQALDEALADPDLEHVSDLATFWKGAFEARRSGLGIPESEWAALGRGRTDAHARAAAIMHHEGVRMMLGTDTPNPFVVPGFSVHRETALLAGAGLSPESVLRSATVEAARYRGELDRVGTVTPGKRAELLLLRSDPLADVAALRDIAAVFVNGYALTKEQLRGLLDEAGAAVRAKPAAPSAPELAPIAPGGSVGREGVFVELYNGAQTGALSFRHTRGADGGIVVDEEQVSGPERRTRRLELASDNTMRSASWSGVNWLGRESGTVVWRNGAYETEITDVDGWRASGRLESPPLFPAPRLATSVLPNVLAAHGPTAVTALIAIDITREGPMSIELPVARQPAGESESTWTVRTAPPPAGPMTFRLADDGSVLEVSEPTPFGLRILRGER